MINLCLNPPVYRSFHVKFDIDIPEGWDITDVIWKFHLQVQLAFDNLACKLKKHFPLADAVVFEISQPGVNLKLPPIQVEKLTGNFLMEAIQVELEDTTILNLKNPFKIEGLTD